MIGLAGVNVAMAADAPEKKSVLSNIDIQVYGYIKLDAIFDTSRVYPGNYAIYVKQEGPYNDDNQLNITANQTRLGLNLSGPEAAGAKTAGKVEMDFYGPGGTENKGLLMMRQAYLELTWTDLNLGLLAGQAWDVFAPMLPDAVNYSVWEGTGEVGYRHPQLRLTGNFKVGEKSSLNAKVALSRNMGHTVTVTSTDSGTDSGMPHVQGSLTFTSPLWTSAPAILCLSGVWGREEYDVNTQNIDFKTYPVWGGAIDVQLPLVDGATLKGSAWKGANLETYIGGLTQGISTTRGESVHTKGGWVCLGLGPMASTKFNLGGTIEMAQWDQIPNGWRSQNNAVWGNAIHNLTSNIQVALEIAQIRTQYKNSKEGDAARTQLAFIYNF